MRILLLEESAEQHSQEFGGKVPCCSDGFKRVLREARQYLCIMVMLFWTANAAFLINGVSQFDV
jgi:hypothetical protein